jgi:hypothetical protein
MKQFIEGRVRLIRLMADKADPFTKVRLLKLAERYDDRVGLRPMHQRTEPIGLPPINIGSPER